MPSDPAEARSLPDRSACPECNGHGVINENGAPYVWGRSDSYECANCDGTGDRYGRTMPGFPRAFDEEGQ